MPGAAAARRGPGGRAETAPDRSEVERRLLESEERFRGLSDAALEGVLLHEGGRIVDANRALCELSGYSAEELRGRSPFELLAPQCREMVYRNLLAEYEGAYEIEALTRDGRPVPCEIRARSIVHHGRVQRVVSVRDLAQRRHEAAVRDSLMAELEACNVEIDRFGYALAHGLKTPIVTIRGFADHLERDVREGRLDRVEPDVQRIREAVTRLQRVLDELQALLRAGQPVGPPVAVAAEDLVREALRLLDSRTGDVLPDVEMPVPLARVYGDRPRLVQLFEQLLAHTRRGAGQPPAVVELRAGDGPEGLATLNVRILGDAGATARAFGALGAPGLASEGVSVGLALLRRIAESHGGRVWLGEGEAGAGAVLSVALPRPPRAADLSEPSGRSAV